MSDGEKLTLKENLDEAIRELQRVRSQLSTLAEIAGSPHKSPEDAGTLVQSLSMRIWNALTHLRAAKGKAKEDG